MVPAACWWPPGPAAGCGCCEWCPECAAPETEAPFAAMEPPAFGVDVPLLEDVEEGEADDCVGGGEELDFTLDGGGGGIKSG